ncbi:MAG: DUF3054 family protein, partial [Chloroflexi bacterium]|nr:DUF3054 family protein [Chloroflexota bacterium]
AALRGSRPTRRALTLAGGDILALLLFVLVGRDTHGASGGWAGAGEVVTIAASFAAAWLAVAPARGALDAQRTAGTRAMAARTLDAWTLAFSLAVLGRALVLGRFSPPAFYVVAYLVPLLLLALWRVAFALGVRRGRRGRRVAAARR